MDKLEKEVRFYPTHNNIRGNKVFDKIEPTNFQLEVSLTNQKLKSYILRKLEAKELSLEDFENSLLAKRYRYFNFRRNR